VGPSLSGIGLSGIGRSGIGVRGAVRQLRSAGFMPDVIICRSDKDLDKVRLVRVGRSTHADRCEGCACMAYCCAVAFGRNFGPCCCALQRGRVVAAVVPTLWCTHAQGRSSCMHDPNRACN
jgi:hypothetical protein